ncbi:M14 family metallopeptidase [Streptomyces sp. NPDC046261]|uniref:M14 family metallopeptidase n=1 Tax=Streptomyces sp. NPDC046261 TaxID=3157200 RepID=UPI0033FEB3D0
MTDPLGDGFAPDYARARAAFRRAASAAGAVPGGHRLPGHAAPDGSPLTVDTAYLGPRRPAKLLVTVSGTHGVEGFAGSACQTRVLLDEGLARAAGPGTGVLLIHALNPYGFAYLRRVDQDNVDLNRNFVDHAAPPHNDAYDAVHAALVPQDAQDDAPFPARELAGELLTLRDRLGTRVFQEAVTRGQYRHPDGLFYGGRRPAWSHRVLRRIVAEHMAGAAHIAYIDLHTGLGERAAGEPIFRGGRDPGARERARAWYGPALTASEEGTSSSTPIVGNTASAVADGLRGGEELTAITLEFGTLPGPQVLLALCADNALHLRRPAAQAVCAPDKRLLLDAFAPADGQWRKSVLQRAREVFDQALSGLAGCDTKAR